MMLFLRDYHLKYTFPSLHHFALKFIDPVITKMFIINHRKSTGNPASGKETSRVFPCAEFGQPASNVMTVGADNPAAFRTYLGKIYNSKTTVLITGRGKFQF
ncbi:MAG: hypothetical protein QNK14_06955 [Desulfobacterales bacterium]|nr:hypothetical protein [Desulfobacterales bacterium]